MLCKRTKYLIFVLAVLLISFGARAQELECNTVSECTALLQEAERKIASLEKDLTATREQRLYWQRQVNYLRNRIKELEKEIKDKEELLSVLEKEIESTQKEIKELEEQIAKDREKLRVLLMELYLWQKRGALESIIVEQDISRYFESKTQLEILIQKNREVIEELRELKENLKAQQEKLLREQEETEKTATLLALQKGEIERSTTRARERLSLLLQEEGKIKSVLEEERRRAQAIRQRLFSLIGVSKAPTFEEALDLARYVEKITGVRPAFLLAVLTQESNIGRNVGQCYLRNPKTGEGVVARTGKPKKRVMHPRRDVPYFLEITRKTGRDPYNTLVSCPMSFGWGGAMGPAQFIPSTWIRYAPRLEAILGRPADPWRIKDSFLAAALLLKDAGADKRTYRAEWRAALIYFAGRVNLRYRFYADSVMRIVARYEKDIALLEKVGKN